MPVVAVSGTPAECGAAYGAQTKDLVAANVASYRRRFTVEAGLSIQGVRAAGAQFRDLTHRHHPRIGAMLDGVADGCGVAVEDIYAVNARTELLYGNHPADPGECTSLGRAGRRTWLAQNWDWHPDQRPYTLLLVTTDETGFTVATLTEAGMVAKAGLNSAGVGACVNLLGCDRDGASGGVPYHVLLRAALDSDSLTIALRAVLRSPRSSSINLLLGQAHDGPGGGEIINVELIPGDAGFLHPNDQGLIAHANHLESGLPVRDRLKDLGGSTFFRAARARRMLTAGLSPTEILADHNGFPNSICRHVDLRDLDADRSESIYAVQLDLDARCLGVATGPACGSTYSWIAVTGEPITATETALNSV